MNGGRSFHRRGGVGAAILLLLPSCDLDTVNIDRTRLNGVEPEFQLNSVIINSAPTLEMLRCETTIVKQHLRVFAGVGACANFNVDARDNMDGVWDNGYQTRLRDLADVLENTADDPDRTNIYNMARIMRAYTVMRITDSYGDVPYTEAVLGLQDGIVFPNYDSQEFIYTSDSGILEALAAAASALDANMPTTNREVLYGGDIARWKRLGYSLLLRGAMRLTKVSPDLAAQYAVMAIEGGVMESNADNAVILHTTEYENPPAVPLNANEGFNEYITADFVDYLKETSDPRLGSIAVRYPTAGSSGEQIEANADRSPDAQIGIPVGYDNNTIAPIAAAQGLPSVYAYSQTDLTRMLHPLAPSFLVTYAQTQLLLAEAADRGWLAGDAASLYESGIRAHMEQISTSYIGTQIAQNDIDAYIEANPLIAGKELELINTQYWVASFLIGDEAWANFRRSCYPELRPNPLQGDLGPEERFMRRLGYPDGERSLNPNVVNGTTPDRIDTRVWWDVRVSEVC